MVCTMLGVPLEDSGRTATWGFDLARAFFPFMSPERRQRAEQSAVEIRAYMDALLAERRRQPQDDVISMLASAETASVLSPAEVQALACNMVFAGLEATAKGVATGVYLLLAHGKLAELSARPDAVETAVLELLRLALVAPRFDADALERVCIETVESGAMTKDLALLIGPEQPWLTTEDFLDALDRRLQAKMA